MFEPTVQVIDRNASLDMLWQAAHALDRYIHTNTTATPDLRTNARDMLGIIKGEIMEHVQAAVQ